MNSNKFTECTIAETFTHPSGMTYKKGAKIKLTDPVGVNAWLKQKWIEDPATEAAATPPAEAPSA